MTCETLDDETVKVKVEHLDVYVYPEEIQIQGSGIDERYEKYDFSQNKNLLQVFFSEFESFILNKSRKSTSLFSQIKSYVLDILSRLKKD